MKKTKKIFLLLASYFIILSSTKDENKDDIKITFNNQYKIENDYQFASFDNCYIYIGNKKIINNTNNDRNNIYIIDQRNSNNPNMRIYNSYKINNITEITNILKILLEYENRYPTNWNRSIYSMKNEWIIHNICYYLNLELARSKHVDLDNEDEETFKHYKTIINSIMEMYNQNEKDINSNVNISKKE